VATVEEVFIAYTNIHSQSTIGTLNMKGREHLVEGVKNFYVLFMCIQTLYVLFTIQLVLFFSVQKREDKFGVI
jgi:hypothetical protein